MTRTDVPPTGDERASLVTLLDYVRDTARMKCDGVSAEDARSAPLPGSPLMTMCGLISHLRWVEHWWFDVIFLGGEDRGPWTDEDPDREMRVAVDIPLADLLADYAADAARHRETVAAHSLDDLAERPIRDGRRMNLRWVLLHLIEETARHNGHLDILRETADGTTGDRLAIPALDLRYRRVRRTTGIRRKGLHGRRHGIQRNTNPEFRLSGRTHCPPSSWNLEIRGGFGALSCCV